MTDMSDMDWWKVGTRFCTRLRVLEFVFRNIGYIGKEGISPCPASLVMCNTKSADWNPGTLNINLCLS